MFPNPCRSQWQRTSRDEQSEPLSLAASAADGLTDKQMESLSSAAAALDELTCTTIHGFCQRLTTPYPIEANVDPGAVMMDEGEADLNHKTLLRQWLRKRLEGPQADDPLAELLVIEGEQGLRLIEQLAEARRARRTARAPEAKLSQKHIRRIPQVSQFVSKMVRRSTESWSSRTYNGRVHLWVRGACRPVRLWLSR